MPLAGYGGHPGRPRRRDKGPQGRGAWQWCCYQEEDLLEAAVAVALGTGQLLPPALTSTLAAPPSGVPPLHPPPPAAPATPPHEGALFPAFALRFSPPGGPAGQHAPLWPPPPTRQQSLSTTGPSSRKPPLRQGPPLGQQLREAQRHPTLQKGWGGVGREAREAGHLPGSGGGLGKPEGQGEQTPVRAGPQ